MIARCGDRVGMVVGAVSVGDGLGLSDGGSGMVGDVPLFSPIS